jgi:protoporphyrinogen oxidase
VNNHNRKSTVVVIGAGFAGLAAGYEIAHRGIDVVILEKDEHIGGLASSFKTKGQPLETFYHHWFKSDEDLIKLVEELGCKDKLLSIPTKTGAYFQNKFFKLCTPLDVLRFKPLNPLDRIRLGLSVLKARRVKDWKQLESITARQWLIGLCGEKAYEVVWKPLLRGKFGPFASEISAVWFWNKLLLRGSSRSKAGSEVLMYYRDGFAALVEKIASEITAAGGIIKTSEPVEALVVENGCIKAVKTPNGTIEADAVIATPALPIIAGLLENIASEQYLAQLRAIKYLANVCLVLELSHRLSDIYWLNVLDSDFPFVGVIEHTNLQPPESYGGSHIVYLSKYLPDTTELYRMKEEQIFEFSIPHIKRMFPSFDRSSVQRYNVFKARYSQPVVDCHYNCNIPSNQTPIKGLYIATMAQIYPEDRGTNYAIRQGRRIGELIANRMGQDDAANTRPGRLESPTVLKGKEK